MMCNAESPALSRSDKSVNATNISCTIWRDAVSFECSIQLQLVSPNTLSVGQSAKLVHCQALKGPHAEDAFLMTVGNAMSP